MTDLLKKLKPNADELTSKDLNLVYGGQYAEEAVAGGDSGDSGHTTSGSEACCCACSCK